MSVFRRAYKIMNRKPSRQTLRTRRLLQEALISLVQEQDFSKLRIQDITDRADLGRATFYMHYSDKEDLLAAVAEKACEEVESQFGKAAGSQGFIGLQWALEHSKDQPELYRVVFGHQRSVERIRSFIIDRATEDLKMKNQAMGVESGPEVDVTAHIMAGGMLGVLKWWLNNDEVLSPEQLKNIFNQLMTEGIHQLKAI
ncbi:MAG: AcrR family transcriptional regulator [Cellvibrionaceae bacterium]